MSYLSLSNRMRMTPVLNPLPSAGHGWWDFQSLPGMYQSDWFSTRPREESGPNSENSVQRRLRSEARVTSVSNTMIRRRSSRLKVKGVC